MDENTPKRACVSCKEHKIKCSRVLPSCRECQKSGRQCVYPTQAPVRFRDQTGVATTRAIQKWRSRSTKQQQQPQPQPQQSAQPSSSALSERAILRPPPDPSVDDLARNRFLFDYTEAPISPFCFDLRELVVEWAEAAGGKGDTPPTGSFQSALDAAALLNFGHRYKDRRATALSVERHHQSLIKLQERIAIGTDVETEDIFAVLLLALYENFHQEGHGVSAWVHHFCAAIKMMMLRSDDAPHQHHFIHLVNVQALHTNIDWEVNAIHLPHRFTAWYRTDLSYLPRSVNLARQVLDFCDRYRSHSFTGLAVPAGGLTEAFAIEQALRELEFDFEQEIPFESHPISTEDYAPFYRSVALHPASPITNHVYPGAWAALSWNKYRIVHVRMLAWILDDPSCATVLSPEMRAEMLELALQRMNDICDSVYAFLMHVGNGRPSPTSFESLPSTGPYCIHSILVGLRKALRGSPSLVAAGCGPKADWIDRTLSLFSECFAISCCRCFNGKDEAAKQAVYARLKFDDL